MNNEHGQKDIKSFFKGASPDVDKELLGGANTGEYIDARNARPDSVDGKSGSLSKIKGEEIQFSNVNLSPDYVCLGSISVNNRQVELWASPTPGELDSIRIDGSIMVQSDNLEFSLDYPFQFDTNEQCGEGEIFLTDNNKVPLIFNIGDIIDNFNAGTQVYFSEFVREIYEINLSTPLDIPVFTELVNVGGGAGLPVGQYSYSIRYVNDAGDRTNFGPQTPLIPVLQGFGANSPEYPYTKTFGGESNLLFNTSYGIKLKFRVTNLLNYDSIEIRRYAWNSNSGLGFTPNPTIVARIPISEGEVSVKEWIDPSDSNVDEVIPDDEDTNQLAFIERAKAIRYFDKRLVLMNYSIADREMTATFLQRNGVEMFPVVDKMGKAGHNDPYYHAYRKSYMGGEEYGFAINGFDGVAGRGFALGVTNFNSYRFPNRREEVSGDSLLYSYNGAPTAANISSNVTYVFEAFDLDDAVTKEDVCVFRNISNDGGKSSSTLQDDCTDDPTQVGGRPNSLGKIEGPYNPYTPTGQSDSNVSGMNYRVNTRVKSHPVTELDYNPEGFAPNFYAKGIALNGVDDLPSWVKAFTVTRTKRADRVVAQGIGFYSLNQADFNAIGNSSLGNKDRNRLWVSLPDVDAGVVNSSIIDDINVNPQNYKVQFVSPLGFFSELYNFEWDNGFLSNNRDRICDMITYARVLTDTGQINPTESGVGVSDYVAYNKYRNSDTAGAGFFNGSDGNQLGDIESFQSVTDGRSNYYELELKQDIYQHQYTGGDKDFSDSGVQDFTEPVYMINIVRDGNTIVDQNIDSYLDTSAYVKIESIIGIGDGTTSDPSFELVDERWEDCIPALDSGSSLATQERFVYIEDTPGVYQPWYNVTYLTPVQVTAIVNDIIANGFHTTSGGVDVYGVYTHTISADQRSFTIEFNIPGFNIIPNDKKIVVRYNNDSPIQVYGGDVTIGDFTFAPIDRQATGEEVSDQIENQFAFNVGLPFRSYYITPRHYVISNANVAGATNIQNSRDSSGNRIYGNIAYFRQLLVNFICESRIANHYAYEGSSIVEKFFPATHYIIRPNRFETGEFSNGAAAVYEDNNIFEQYEDDYGDEYLYWTYGGFRFNGLRNIDYSQESPVEFFSKADVGYTEENEYCTGIIWSLSRAINQQDSPGLKTFVSSNTYTITDAQGEIKKAWDANGPRGENLYAFTNKGTCLLLTKKSILYGANGAEIGTSQVDNFINSDLWLNKNVGMFDEFWRSHAEASIELIGEDGSQHVEAIFFANNRSVFRMYNDSIVDIGKTKYYSELNTPLSLVLPSYGSRMAGFYDENYETYGLQMGWSIPNVGAPATNVEDLFSFSQGNRKFLGKYDYRFDQYVFNNNTLHGVRDGETYSLDRGFIINGSPIQFEVLQVAAPAAILESEFMLINVNSNEKPTRIEFYNEDMQLLCAMDSAIQGPSYLKKYDGYRNHIPRQDTLISTGRDRVQDRLLIYKIIHNLEDRFDLKSCFVDYKKIK